MIAVVVAIAVVVHLYREAIIEDDQVVHRLRREEDEAARHLIRGREDLQVAADHHQGVIIELDTHGNADD